MEKFLEHKSELRNQKKFFQIRTRKVLNRVGPSLNFYKNRKKSNLFNDFRELRDTILKCSSGNNLRHGINYNTQKSLNTKPRSQYDIIVEKLFLEVLEPFLEVRQSVGAQLFPFPRKSGSGFSQSGWGPTGEENSQLLIQTN